MTNLQKRYDELCERTYYWADRAEAEGYTEEIETGWAETMKEIEEIEKLFAEEG